jgi:hypothetical protein
MRKRVILLLVGAAVLALAAAAPVLLAMVRTAAPDPYTTPVPFGWNLQLRGVKHGMNLNNRAFRALEAVKGNAVTIMVDDAKTPDDPSDDTACTGIPLARLVGLIDDKNPATFNTKLAMKGAGYGVEVMGVDYFSYVYSSKDVAAFGNTLVVANLANGAPLAWGSVKVSGTTGTFKPTWPLRLVCSDSSVTGKMKPSGILRISIVAAPPAPSPSASPSTSPSSVAAPF